MPESREINCRLESLERTNRRWRLAFTLAALLLGSALWLGAAGPDFQRPTVRAHRVVADEFILRDEAGRVRATLKTGERGPMLEFFDSDGRLTRSVGPAGFKPLEVN